MIYRFATDSEFIAPTGEKTVPVSIGLQDSNKELKKFFLHPRAPIPENFRVHETFSSEFAPFDFYGLEWRRNTDIEITSIENGVRHTKKIKADRPKNFCRFESYIFFSYKDLEFLFRNEDDYRKFLIPFLSRIRRISSERSIRLPWDVKVRGEDGKMRWHVATLSVKDICALQGAGNLDTYAKNVGITLENKHSYTPQEKSRMDLRYIEDPYKFEQYNLGDLDLIPIYEKTQEFYNEVANKIDVAPKDVSKGEDWGMSTGKIVASMVAEYLSNKIGVSPKEFFKLTDYAGSKGITSLSKFLKNRSLIYAGMTDGGRAQRERLKPKSSTRDVIRGILLDIDISSCYGSGLLNQKFAVGNPSIITEKLTLRKFLKKYKKQFIPGLWCARITCPNLPFKQDLVMSKTQECFNTWNWGWNGDFDGFCRDDNKYVYDAQLVATTNEIHQGLLNHDILQVLENYSNNREWGYLLDNAIIESALVYEKRNRVKEVNSKMMGEADHTAHKTLRFKQLANHDSPWVEIDLSPLLITLISERKKYAKGMSLNQFLKLVINTIYGCCCSEYFSSKGTGISNVVVANNITARARTLAWTMAKGFGSYMTVTDGGVFDVNKVLNYKRKSLDIFANIYTNTFTDKSRHIVVTEKSLLDKEIDSESIKELMKPAYTSLDTKKESDSKIIDVMAWNHLSDIFGKIDIFSKSQFQFESKEWYTKLTIHSKVDYRLVNEYNESTNIKMRGLPLVWDENKEKKVPDPKINNLFDCIEKGVGYIYAIESYTRMISQKEWEKREDKGYLLPHDQVNKPKLFYSVVPLAIRPTNLTELKKFNREYCKAKEGKDANILQSMEQEKWEWAMRNVA